MDQVSATEVKVRVPASLTSLAPGGFVRSRLAEAPVVLSLGQEVVAYDALEDAEAEAVVAEFHGPVVYLRVNWATRKDLEEGGHGPAAGTMVFVPYAPMHFGWDALAERGPLFDPSLIAFPFGDVTKREGAPRVEGAWQLISSARLIPPTPDYYDAIKHFTIVVKSTVPHTFNRSNIAEVIRAYNAQVMRLTEEVWDRPTTSGAGDPPSDAENEALAG